MDRATPPPGYRTQSRDTTYAAERFLIERYRELAPHQRLALLTQLVRAAHELSLAGLRMRYPEANARELELRAAAVRIGRDLVRKATGVAVPRGNERIHG